jgi:signal transduction histidine kinase
MAWSVPRVRSWIWGAIALVIGLGLYVCDDWIESLQLPSIPKSIINYLEIIVMGPALATLAFLASEQLYLREERYRSRIEQERQKRFHFLGRIAASVAHEMRNPLHNLILLSNELALHLLPADRELCERIRGNLERMDGATHLIYELARRERKIDGDSQGTIVLPALIKQVIMELQERAHPPAAISMQEPAADLVSAGRLEGVRIILLNILRNAIEAAAGGVVQITFPESKEYVQVEVRNRGAIDLHQLSEDVEASSTKPGGLGVGLAIARHLAMLYGGVIDLATEDGWVIAMVRLPHGS